MQDQATPLYMAVLNRSEEAVRALIDAGADVNIQCFQVSLRGLEWNRKGEKEPEWNEKYQRMYILSALCVRISLPWPGTRLVGIRTLHVFSPSL
jgi:hypothetical protein